MLNGILSLDLKKPGLLFCFGWAALMLSLVVSIQPVWDTFIHPWRVEFTASIFLFVALAYSFYQSRGRLPQLNISHDELNFIVLPVMTFILWSAISIIWSPSWKSALHHTAIWAGYLIFYLFVRPLLDRERNYGMLLTMLSCTLAFFSVFAIFAYGGFLIFGGEEMLGRGVYPKYGEQINTIFPLLTVGVLRLSGARFRWGIATLAVLWLLIFCSLGRINLFLFVCAAAATAAAIFSFRRFHKYRHKMAIVCIMIVLAPLPLHVLSLFSEDSTIPMVGRLRDETMIGNSNNLRKLMASISIEMASSHPLIGIGADNFGFETNNYRSAYSTANPNDPNLEQGESVILERVHNEYLQILAELGIVGGMIFLWLVAGIVVMAFRAIRNIRTISLYPVAALIGIAMFLASSLVTSYSFRLVQNGFVFFFVLAVAAKLLLKERAETERRGPLKFSPLQIKFGYAVGMLACLTLTGYSLVRVGSMAYTTSANYTKNLDEAIPLYQNAMLLDDENPEARYFLGMRLIEKGKYTEAVPLLQESIRIGKARSEDFSFLASAQSLAGNPDGAEKTFTEAAALYPQSAFVLTRYAALLRANGREVESKAQLGRATRLNRQHANTWWTMLTVSPQAAADQSVLCDEYVPLMDLLPQPAMFAVKAEREIRFPNERLSVAVNNLK